MDAKLKSLFEGIISATIAGDTQSVKANELVKEMLTIKTQRILSELADVERISHSDGEDDLDDETLDDLDGVNLDDENLDDENLDDENLDDENLDDENLDDEDGGSRRRPRDLDDEDLGDGDDDELPPPRKSRSRSRFDEPM